MFRRRRRAGVCPKRDPPQKSKRPADGMPDELEMIRSGLYMAVGLGNTMHTSPGACVFGMGVGTQILCDMMANDGDVWATGLVPPPPDEPREEEER